jgi:hypothetical protein
LIAYAIIAESRLKETSRKSDKEEESDEKERERDTAA